MSEKSKSIHDRQSRFHLLLLPVVIACSSLLVSCGGGGESDFASTTESADGTKQALAVSGAPAVPPGWTGRAPKMEVINGITVPPEPPPTTNNATLAGIDVNGNGVRDDVERSIATVVSTVQQFNNAIPLVKAYQSILSAPTPTTRIGALALEKTLLCSATDYSSVPSSLRPTSNSSIESLVFNTDDRKGKLQSLRAIVGGFDSGEVNCD